MTKIALKSLDGTHLNMADQGAGPVIVALHGFTGDLAAWDSFSAAASARYRIVAIDLPGHGRSGAPDEVFLYTMERTVAALRELLERHGIGDVFWLGYSLGGRLALGAATAMPSITAGLILESASPGLAAQEEREARVNSDARLADWLESVGIEEFVDYWGSLPLWASQWRLSSETRNRLRRQRLGQVAAGLANSLRGAGTGAQPSLHGRLSEIAAPTLLVAGEEDAKFAGIAEAMHTAIPGSTLRIVEEAGHAVHLEQPERFSRIVLEFLDGATARSRPSRVRRGAP